MGIRQTLRETEAGFQRALFELAAHYGWMRHHTRPARTQHGGWITPIMGERGFLDVIFARPGELIITELKIPPNRLSPHQQAWYEILRTVPGIEVYIWMPNDWDQILARLGRHSRAS